MPKKKHDPKKGIIDEWEISDIDRDEQEKGLKRRKKRWKEIEHQQRLEKKATKLAIKNAEKMKPSGRRQPSMIEAAWLKCDYVLNNVMEKRAYDLMEFLRMKDPECYKALYKIFMSKNMMIRINFFVDFFAKGGEVPERVKLADVVKHYRKYKGIKSKIKVIRKGEDEYEL